MFVQLPCPTLEQITDEVPLEIVGKRNDVIKTGEKEIKVESNICLKESTLLGLDYCFHM